MTKSTGEKTKGAMPTKKARKAPKTAKGQTKAAEYADCLLELHKLQGTLLSRLRKEI